MPYICCTDAGIGAILILNLITEYLIDYFLNGIMYQRQAIVLSYRQWPRQLDTALNQPSAGRPSGVADTPGT